MALPSGITPKTVTIGIASFFDGTIASGRVTISAPVNVVHLPTNRPIFSSDMTKPFVDGVASFDLCPTDADGLNNKSWTYKCKVEVSGANAQPEVIYFPLPEAGPDVVDLDGLVTVPSSAGVPISVPVVTSVNGMTGDVVIEAGAGGGGGAVDSVNGQTGVVNLGPEDVKAWSTNTVALLGTSITDANAPYNQGSGVMADTGAGYFHWANACLRQSLVLTLEAGVSGDTTGGMEDRVGDVIASGARMCVVETGPNDIQGDSTFTLITNQLTGIYEALRAAGILVFACHINPTTTIVGTPSRLALMHRVNRWISAYARTHPGIAVVPWSARMTDPATGGPLAGTLHDGTHPNTYGASIMGSALADIMEPYVVAAGDLVYSNADPASLTSNPMMLGGTTVATGWTVNASGAVYSASKVARADGDPGEWQQFAITSGTVEFYSPIGTTGWTAGDAIFADFEVDGDLTNATRIEAQVWAVDGSGFPITGGAALTLSDYYAAAKRVPLNRAVLRSRPLTIPAGATGVRGALMVAGPATVRLSRSSVRKVNI